MKTNHYKIEFGFGVGKDRNQNFISPAMREAALQTIQAEAARRFGAYTLTKVAGGWKNPAGVLVTEEGYTLTIIIPQTSPTHSFARFIGAVLEQEAVAITITPVYFEIFFT